MDSHAYTEYAFYIGSLSFDQLIDEAELIDADIEGCETSEQIRAALLLKAA